MSDQDIQVLRLLPRSLHKEIYNTSYTSIKGYNSWLYLMKIVVLFWQVHGYAKATVLHIYSLQQFLLMGLLRIEDLSYFLDNWMCFKEADALFDSWCCQIHWHLFASNYYISQTLQKLNRIWQSLVFRNLLFFFFLLKGNFIHWFLNFFLKFFTCLTFSLLVLIVFAFAIRADHD